MNYKNINVNELGLKQKIVYRANRVAMFVPRLLKKLSSKLTFDPIKSLTGQTHQQIVEEAVNKTILEQEEQAVEMQPQIDEGMRNLEEWKNDEYYYETEKAKFKSYKSFVDDLVKKQNKLRQFPKRLLVAKNYFVAMKEFRENRKEQKQMQKDIQKIVNEYQVKRESLIAKKLRVEALEEALRKEKEELEKMQQDVVSFETEHNEIISQLPEIEAEVVQQEEMVENVVSQEPVVQPVEPVFENVVPQEPAVQPVEPVVESVVPPRPVVQPVQMPAFESYPMTPLEENLLSQMGFFARQDMSVEPPSDFEAFGLEEGMKML